MKESQSGDRATEESKGKPKTIKSKDQDAMTIGRSASGNPQASKRKETARLKFFTRAEPGRAVKPKGIAVKPEEKWRAYGHKAE